MPYIEPNGDLILFKDVPFDPNYENTMYFQTLADQNTYFGGRTYLSFTHLSYTRRSRGLIRVQVPISTAYQYSYMRYRNTEFENKWFYAFVTKVEYVNNITTDIYFDIDLIQTWYFDNAGNYGYVFEQCLIEREHVSIREDALGTYGQIPENFNVGDYVVSEGYVYNLNPVIVLASTLTLDGSGNEQDVIGQMYNGRVAWGSYYSGVEYYLFDPYVQAEIDNLNAILEYLSRNNKIDAVISIFMGAREVWLGSPAFQTITAHRGTDLDGYTVYNKKLLRYPYNFLQVSNLMGEKTDLRFEFSDVANNDITLERYGNQTTRPAVITYPSNYRGLASDFENIVTTECFPQCSYNNDTFKAWLAQNQGTLIAQGVANIAAIGMGAITGNTSPAVSGVLGLASMIGTAYDKSTLPATNHGNSNGDVMFQAGLCGIGVYRMSVRHEIAKEFDMFLDMYGYAVNRVGTPLRMTRPCWTYLKTKGCQVAGELPAEDKKAIEAIYDKGIRFWRTTATFGVYDPLINDNYTEPA